MDLSADGKLVAADSEDHAVADGELLVTDASRESMRQRMESMRRQRIERFKLQQKELMTTDGASAGGVLTTNGSELAVMDIELVVMKAELVAPPVDGACSG